LLIISADCRNSAGSDGGFLNFIVAAVLTAVSIELNIAVEATGNKILAAAAMVCSVVGTVASLGMFTAVSLAAKGATNVVVKTIASKVV